MQLGFCRTALAAVQLSTVFIRVSRLVKMTTSRGLKSGPAGNNLTDNQQGKPLWNTSQDYEEEFPSLSVGASSMQSKRRTRIDLGTPSKQKTEKEVENIGPIRLEEPSSISHQNSLSLPSSYGQKRPYSRKDPKHRQAYNEHGVAKKNSMDSPGIAVDEPFDVSLPGARESSTKRSYANEKNSANWVPNSRNRQAYNEHGVAKKNSVDSQGITVDEPFDICLPQARESNTRRSNVNEKNSGKWIPKVQSAEENEQQEDNVMKNSSLEYPIAEGGQVLRSGMVLFKNYVSLSKQVDIVLKCQELGLGQGGFYRPGYDDGAKLRLYMMCLGLDWNPQTKRYGEIRRHDNVAPPNIPHEFASLVNRALDDSHTLIKRDLKTTDNVEEILPAMSPDVCIVNFYTTNGRLGLHQDRDESRESLRKGLPVVSISLGDSAEFLYGDDRYSDNGEIVLLQSGDVLIFGGESRHIFHGVKTIRPDTAPSALVENTKLRPGRLNLTFRKY